MHARTQTLEIALIYRFGLFELDAKASEFRRQGRVVPLQEQPLLVLEALLERPGEVVEREILRARLWPEDHHVDFEGGINAAVRRLREALGDSASNPRFVVTVPRRGYRLVAPVEAIDEGPAEAESVAGPVAALANSAGLGWRLTILAAVIFAIVISASQVLDGFRDSQPVAQGNTADKPALRLAVLPFATHSPDPNRAFLGDALTDELIVRLGRLQPQRLQVIARTSVQGFRDGRGDLATVTRELGVDFVLEGSVQQQDDQVRIHVALVETEFQNQIWSRSFERKIGDLLALEREIAEHVAQELALELKVAGGSATPKGRAHELYLEGSHFLQQLGETDLRIALRSFDAAVAIDPSYAEAYAGSAVVWVLMGTFDFADPSVAFPNAQAFAEQALALDPDSANATLVLALVQHLYAWDFAAAEPLFRRALELDPGSPYAHLFAAAFEAALGRQERALELAHRALDLDPLSPTVNAELCWRLFVARRFDDATARCRRSIELSPSFLLGWDALKWVHIRQGHEQAVSDFLRVVELEGDHIDQIAFLQQVADRQGIEGLLRLSLDEPERRLAESGQSPFNLALDHAALGDEQQALHWLEQAYEARESDLVVLAVDPRLDVLRGHPRFQSLVNRMGLDGVDSGFSATLDPLP